MKKILLSAALLASATLASAQNVGNPTKPIYGHMYLLPGQFTNGNKEYAIEPVGESNTINIYDSNLTIVKTITSKNPMASPDYANRYDVYLYATQTLFNDDDKFEYIEELEDGINIASEDGKILQTIKFPNLNTYISKVLSLDDKMYLIAADRENGCNYAYPITRTATGVNSVGAPQKLLVSPTVASRSEQINVEIGGDSSASREITVVNAAGQTVVRKKLAAGEKSVTIDSSRLSRGMNIVKVSNGSEPAECCKIFIR